MKTNFATSLTTLSFWKGSSKVFHVKVLFSFYCPESIFFLISCAQFVKLNSLLRSFQLISHLLCPLQAYLNSFATSILSRQGTHILKCWRYPSHFSWTFWRYCQSCVRKLNMPVRLFSPYFLTKHHVKFHFFALAKQETLETQVEQI